MLAIRSRKPVLTPVLVVDALGIAGRIASADAPCLAELSETLDRQYLRFRAKIPFRIGAMLFGRVWGSGEFSTFRLNDMFLLYSTKEAPDYSLRYLVSSVLLYQTLLLGAFIPRGGLGFGLVLQGKQSVLGSGFIDAYGMVEQRPESCKDICAILASPAFLTGMQHTAKAQRLLCFYEGRFYVHPRALVDPESWPERVRKMFAGLRSRCTTPLAWAAARTSRS